jgi:hypothetical protein
LDSPSAIFSRTYSARLREVFINGSQLLGRFRILVTFKNSEFGRLAAGAPICYEHVMRRVLLLLSVIALAAPAAAEPQQGSIVAKTGSKAGSKSGSTAGTRTAPGRDHPAAVRPSRDPCAEFGPGFARAPGSDTCVRFGGGIGVGIGTPGTLGH